LDDLHLVWADLRERPAFRGDVRPLCDDDPGGQPGARPPEGGAMASKSSPLLAISHEISELEFHISPVASSSRPQTGVGTSATSSSTRCASETSSVNSCGLSTASSMSAITPSRQRRTS
jgi:hypothetical protein